VALEVLSEAGEDPLVYLTRHASGDWGEIYAHDRRENERSLKHGWRILSSYPVEGKTIWIITMADRSVYYPPT
jgi:sugar phosphate permease